MGLWNWLSGKKRRTTSTDRIWLTEAARRLGLVKEVQAAVRPVVLLAHFPATLDDACADLIHVGLAVERCSVPLTTKQLDQWANTTERVVYASLVKNLRDLPSDASEHHDSLLEIFVAERHFLRRYDEQILTFAEGLQHRCHVTFHLSLEAPLMRELSGEWVRGMLERLGMTEQEAIESEMVARRIRAAQDHFAKRVDEDRETATANDWLIENGFG